MRTCRTVASLRRALAARAGDRVGFVPTMGCLHEGHLSLVRASRRENDVTVVSVYVNPSQFAPGEDLDRYPRDERRDAALLRREGADVLFLPADAEMYPAPYRTWVDVAGLDGKLCGRSRPGHFRGVATVVLKLLNLVRPQRAYFGQKDAQQALVIRQMVRDLHLGVRLRVLPIVRDADGLALSSRNAYLSAEERRAALALPKALRRAQARVAAGERDARALRAAMAAEIGREPLLQVDYIAVVRLDNLEDTAAVEPGNTLVAVAVRAGRTRLIDNFLCGEISC
ncbi:MAG TPA: pantoate--beta-alanine ligase [Candidatus Aminicenantes bacterium]|nr:pantoate--beta-alanine ligase [Candidatus Aminicenantes bacterium]